MKFPTEALVSIAKHLDIHAAVVTTARAQKLFCRAPIDCPLGTVSRTCPGGICIVRAFALASILVVLLIAGCSTPSGDPAPHLTREAAIAWARGIDPCALVDRGALASLGPITTVGTSGRSTACEAALEDTAASWSLILQSNEFHVGSQVRIDGVTVRKVDAAELLPPLQRYMLIRRTCSYDVPFENSIAVRVQVTAPLEQDACGMGRPLVRSVLANWPKHPAQGSSPDTTLTPLTDALPCAAVPALKESHRVVMAVADQTLNTCVFTVEGAKVEIRFGYRDRDEAGSAARPATFGPHSGSVEVSDGGALARVEMGSAFTGVQAGPRRLVPSVDVRGDDAATVSVVMAEAVGQIRH
ncbi:hypothetical protein [Mycolicibacterium fortuitum]|uniref:hypothetical protein n=1 Tax=Mycolicibacterium fortuitum TaxID=1766 RepID=UPI00262E9508|nr:hypothetical protein [Mycolicibacterium fortuitum]